MSRRLPRLDRGYLWPPLLMLTVFFASGRSELALPDLSTAFISRDKLGHFLVFGLLATAIVRTPALRTARAGQLLLAAAIASSFGAFDEARQSLTPGRQVELADWLADTTGALVAVTAYRFWPIYRRSLEYPLSRRLRDKALRIREKSH